MSVFLFAFTFSGEPEREVLKADDVVGLWKVGSGKAIVEVYRHNNMYYGKIVWLEKPLNRSGEPHKDVNNPNPKLRDNPVVGLIGLRDFKYIGNHTWDHGKIYNPDSGKEYKSVMRMKDINTLDVRGYIGVRWVGKTDTWERLDRLP
ncbi:MAG: DUF2147 domain-containing protein [Cytophagaceae bacterium]